MDDSLDLILHSDEWTPELRATLKSDPELAARVALWLDVSAEVGRGLQQDLPAADDLVRIALVRSGHGELLGPAEQDATQKAERVLEAASASHPSVAAIMQRLDNDIRAFDSAWNATLNKPAPDRKPVMRLHRPVLFRRVAWAAVAACVIMIAVFTGLPDGLTHIAGSGQSIDLADGSTVRLDAGAELMFDLDTPRSVTLKGRAFFDVKPGDTPFTVTTDDAVTAVLGTSFGVLDTDSGTDVSVLSGRVSVQADGQSVILSPGWATRVTAGFAPAPPEPAVASDLAWSGLFIFRDTPIDSVASILANAFGVNIQVDSTLASQVLTGTFDQDQGLEEILTVVASALGATVEPVETGLHYRLVPLKE